MRGHERAIPPPGEGGTARSSFFLLVREERSDFEAVVAAPALVVGNGELNGCVLAADQGGGRHRFDHVIGGDGNGSRS